MARRITFYGYDQCSTCRAAKRWLADRGVAFDAVDITTQPPPKSLLRAIVDDGAYTLPQLFNRSGELYRSLNMRERINVSSPNQLLDLLAAHGKLIKWPIVSDGDRHTVGFDENRMGQVWSR